MQKIEAFLADGRDARTTLRRNVEHVLDNGRMGNFAESVVVRSRAMHDLLERNDRLEALVRELVAQVNHLEAYAGPQTGYGSIEDVEERWAGSRF